VLTQEPTEGITADALAAMRDKVMGGQQAAAPAAPPAAPATPAAPPAAPASPAPAFVGTPAPQPAQS